MSIVMPLEGSGDYVLSPSKIVALGLNYADHIAETGTPTPTEPVIFAKTPNVLVGDGEDIVIPAFLRESGLREPTVHYEAELAVVIGRRARRVPASTALEHVLGYTCFNDVSQRELQFGDMSGWFRGKSLDTFGPVGPRIVPLDSLRNPGSLHMECHLNGETVQSASTADMLFDVPHVISWISAQLTLEPGDIIATGTPSGVGRLTHGDVVEVEIEGIGTLRNRVVEERPAGGGGER